MMAKTSTNTRVKTKTVPCDVADQLRLREEMAACLDAWPTEAPDDAAGIARALWGIARAQGMSKVARESGLSRESLYKALTEDGNRQSGDSVEGGEGARPSIARQGGIALSKWVKHRGQISNLSPSHPG